MYSYINQPFEKHLSNQFSYHNSYQLLLKHHLLMYMINKKMKEVEVEDQREEVKKLDFVFVQ